MLKILVVGDTYTGKTSVVKRFVYNKFNNEQRTNLSCDYDLKIVKI